jgi:hypothetical protein
MPVRSWLAVRPELPIRHLRTYRSSTSSRLDSGDVSVLLSQHDRIVSRSVLPGLLHLNMTINLLSRGFQCSQNKSEHGIHRSTRNHYMRHKYIDDVVVVVLA